VPGPVESSTYIICNAHGDERFRACKGTLKIDEPDGVTITVRGGASAERHGRRSGAIRRNAGPGGKPAEPVGHSVRRATESDAIMSEAGGETFSSHNPATGEVVWTGRSANAQDVERAVAAAERAFDEWSSQPIAARIKLLNAFADQLKQRKSDLVEMICRETGKPRWESGTEVDAMIGKVAISIDAHERRRHETTSDNAGVTSATRYKPYGVVAVLGPFNFPGHLPNGHIVPALLAGNTVVFKPSELTPGVAQLTLELWQSAGLPAGVLNVVQGGRETGSALVQHPAIAGVFFTGSFAVGRRDQPRAGGPTRQDRGAGDGREQPADRAQRRRSRRRRLLDDLEQLHYCRPAVQLRPPADRGGRAPEATRFSID
jgi:delta 1-pyrroline-5-carboxylate dehydrogenase